MQFEDVRELWWLFFSILTLFLSSINLPIIISINWLVVWIIKHQKTVKYFHHNFIKLNVMSLDISFCPTYSLKYKNIKNNYNTRQGKGAISHYWEPRTITFLTFLLEKWPGELMKHQKNGCWFIFSRLTSCCSSRFIYNVRYSPTFKAASKQLLFESLWKNKKVDASCPISIYSLLYFYMNYFCISTFLFFNRFFFKY